MRTPSSRPSSSDSDRARPFSPVRSIGWRMVMRRSPGPPHSMRHMQTTGMRTSATRTSATRTPARNPPIAMALAPPRPRIPIRMDRATASAPASPVRVRRTWRPPCGRSSQRPKTGRRTESDPTPGRLPTRPPTSDRSLNHPPPDSSTPAHTSHPGCEPRGPGRSVRVLVPVVGSIPSPSGGVHRFGGESHIERGVEP